MWVPAWLLANNSACYLIENIELPLACSLCSFYAPPPTQLALRQMPLWRRWLSQSSCARLLPSKSSWTLCSWPQAQSVGKEGSIWEFLNVCRRKELQVFILLQKFTSVHGHSTKPNSRQVLWQTLMGLLSLSCLFMMETKPQSRPAEVLSCPFYALVLHVSLLSPCLSISGTLTYTLFCKFFFFFAKPSAERVGATLLHFFE